VDKRKAGHAGHSYSPKHASKYATLSYEVALTCEAMFRLQIALGTVATISYPKCKGSAFHVFKGSSTPT
jgi:hypothetical protein